jgi:myosin-1
MSFVADGEHGDHAAVADQDILRIIAGLFAVDEEQLEKALCSRTVAARGEVMEKRFTLEEAAYAKDAFAKVLIMLFFQINYRPFNCISAIAL